MLTYFRTLAAALSFLTIFLNTFKIYSDNQSLVPQAECGERAGMGIRFNQPFKIDSDRMIDSILLRNFAKEIDSIMCVGTITKVNITGLSSIDGPVDLNDKLAEDRALAMASWLEKTTGLHSGLFSIHSKGEDWNMFRGLVENDSCIPSRSAIITILSSSLSEEEKEKELRYLDNGTPWSYLAENIFPEMRCVEVDLEVKPLPLHPEPKKAPVESEIIELDVVETASDEIYETPLADTLPEEWRRRFYIKTDLPYWLMSWSNVAFEVDMAPHWSFNLPIYFSAVNYFKTTLKFRLFAFQPGIRYWLKGTNTGVYFEAHYTMGWWNFAFNGPYRYQDHYRKSPSVGGGIGAGYRLPISKNGRWAMEFGGGVGVYRLNYDRFQNHTNGKLIDSHKKTVFFIDNVNVSISYSFPIEKKK